MDYANKGIDNAIAVSTIRVTGPKQVRVRNRLALGYLYQGWRNAGRQLSRMMGDLLDCLPYLGLENSVGEIE